MLWDGGVTCSVRILCGGGVTCSVRMLCSLVLILGFIYCEFLRFTLATLRICEHYVSEPAESNRGEVFGWANEYS